MVFIEKQDNANQGLRIPVVRYKFKQKYEILS